MTEDLWENMRTATQARIGLGRSGDALPTSEHLKFQLAHAQARDAVHAEVDFDSFEINLGRGPLLRLQSAARTRAEYLLRPDLGRRLDENSRAKLPPCGCMLAFVVADGLSARAIEQHAVPLLNAFLGAEQTPPICLVRQGRVAVGDEVGSRLGAEIVVVLVGERPGLSVPDSLGIYVTWDPRVGRKDSERNCISNVHAGGLSYEEAALKLHRLLCGARELGATGIALKEPDAVPSRV